MNLEQLKQEWESDCNIDDNYLAEASTRTANLHSKYLNMLVDFKLKQSKMKSDVSILRQNKSRWFRGEMSKEDLDSLGWDQWQYNKMLKSEISDALEGDKDVIDKTLKLEYINTIVYFLESVMGQLKSRDFQIKNSIQMRIFLAGN